MHTGLQVTLHLVFVPLLVLVCFFVFSLSIFSQLVVLCNRDSSEQGFGGGRSRRRERRLLFYLLSSFFLFLEKKLRNWLT